MLVLLTNVNPMCYQYIIICFTQKKMFIRECSYLVTLRSFYFVIHLQFYHCIYLFVWLDCNKHEHMAWNLLIKSVLSLSRLHPAEYREICFVTKKYKQNILFQSVFKGYLIIPSRHTFLFWKKHHDPDKIEQKNWLNDQNTLQML